MQPLAHDLARYSMLDGSPFDHWVIKVGSTQRRCRYVQQQYLVPGLFSQFLQQLSQQPASPRLYGGGSSVKEILVAKQWSDGPNSFSRPLGTHRTPKKSDHRIYQSKWRIFSVQAHGRPNSVLPPLARQLQPSTETLAGPIHFSALDAPS